MDHITLKFIICIIVSSHCLSLAILVLFRIGSIRNKTEGVLFLSLCVSAAVWSFGPVTSAFTLAYGWLSALFITDVAVIYMLYITERKWASLFIIATLISNFLIIFWIFKGESNLVGFPVKFGFALFPLLLGMNAVVYVYAFVNKTRFHLILGVMASLMILGGFYDTFKLPREWVDIPAATLSTFGFIIVVGYHILKGYLSIHGWSDYAKELEKHSRLLQSKVKEIRKAHVESVIVLSQTIEAKDFYTRGHCVRVSTFAKALATELKLPRNDVFEIEMASILHDIGKIGIPGAILNKPGQLTPEEFAVIKKHPDIGADILKNVDFFRVLTPYVRQHHEFYDGHGYPLGLKGEEICLPARIIAVADVYDAVTSDRPYRKAFSESRAIEILQSALGTQLDPVLTEIFIRKKIYQVHAPEGLAPDFAF